MICYFTVRHRLYSIIITLTDLDVDLNLDTVIIASDRGDLTLSIINYLLSDRRSECKLGKIDSVRSG